MDIEIIYEVEFYSGGIMIPACEEFLYLPKAIESLSKLPYKKVLVVVVNQRKKVIGFILNNKNIIGFVANPKKVVGFGVCGVCQMSSFRRENSLLLI